MKIYNNRPVNITIEIFSLRFFFFFDHWNIHYFQSNQRFQATEFVDRPQQQKLDTFRISLS